MSSTIEGANKVLPLEAGSSDFNAISFLVRQVLSVTRTTTLVQVVECTNDGGLSPVGYVDVKVLVHRLDGAGNTVDAGVIHNVPYMRVQGGANAVIIDPQVGDIGWRA